MSDDRFTKDSTVYKDVDIHWDKALTPMQFFRQAILAGRESDPDVLKLKVFFPRAFEAAKREREPGEEG